MSIKRIESLKSYSEERSYLEMLNLLLPHFKADHTIDFIEYEEVFVKELRKGKSQFELTTKIRVVMRIIGQECGRTFLGTVKKTVFLHMFIHHIAKNGSYTQSIAALVETYLKEIESEDISIVLGTRQQEKKHEGSLTKIYNGIVRSLSKSKGNSSKSNLKLQNPKERGSLSVIVTSIVLPFVSYLLKLNQDPKLYTSITRRNFDLLTWSSLKWKIHNYMAQLGKLIMELNRVGRYYKEEILGVWVILYYRMSCDIAVYYQLLGGDIIDRANMWKEKINVVEKLYKINKRHKIELEQMAKNMQLLELKQEIEMLQEEKEKIIYLYQNLATAQYANLMDKPHLMKCVNRVNQLLEFILDFCQQNKAKVVGLKKQTCIGLVKKSSSDSLGDSKKQIGLKKNRSDSMTAPISNIHEKTLPLQQKFKGQQVQETIVTPNSLISTTRRPQIATRSNNFIAKKNRAMGL